MTGPAPTAPTYGPCSGCQFYQPVGTAAQGQCRINPPVIAAAPVASTGTWPSTVATGWCGDFKQGTPPAPIAGSA